MSGRPSACKCIPPAGAGSASTGCPARGLTAAIRASSASAIRAVARTRAIVWAEPMSSPPVTSTTPRMSPATGSWMGAAAQLHRWTGTTKCSAARIATGASSRRAVPGALVPAWPSSRRPAATLAR